MNEDKLKNMPDYIKNLPKALQDFVFDGVWQERTEEIAKKYSLGPAQTETLSDNVLFVLIGLDQGEDFVKMMPSELGISKLLAGQIVEELDVRVFEYALKSLENKLGDKLEEKPVDKVVNKTDNLKTTNNKPGPQTPKVPEIRPEIVPMIEEGEAVKVVTKIDTKTTELTGNKPEVPIKTKIEPETKPKEVVQAPIPVPRFVASPIDEGEVAKEVVTPKEPTPNPLEKINQKLNINTTPKPDLQKPEDVQKPTKGYVVDPYREPIE